jgi:hypothetical protein
MSQHQDCQSLLEARLALNAMVRLRQEQENSEAQALPAICIVACFPGGPYRYGVELTSRRPQAQGLYRDTL